MPGRQLLVVGSECAALGELGFIEELATNLHAKLVAAGDWSPVVNTDAVLNPTIAELHAAVDTAFTNADKAQATLLLAFIGHGFSKATSDFYLLAADSPLIPTSRTGFHLVQEIRERLLDKPGVDGVVVLVDACEVGQGVAGAANRWVEVLGGISGRMELMVASGDGNAYDGCFTRTLLSTLEDGLARSGESLLCADLLPEIAHGCPRQRPQHLTFNGGNVAHGDPGLWLVPNLARQRDAVRGTPSAGFVDQLTRNLLLTNSMREHLTTIIELQGARLRAIVGPAGSGKSTLLAVLIRPRLVDTLTIDIDYIAAAVFLDATSTLESLTTELSAQLARRRFGSTTFAAAHEQTLTELTDEERNNLHSFELDIIRPLQRCRTGGVRVNLIIDGLDQTETGSMSLILSAINRLTNDASEKLDHVRVLIGVRAGTKMEQSPELAHARRIEIPPPTPMDLFDALGLPFGPPGSGESAAPIAALIEQIPHGGWLIAGLIAEMSDTPLEEVVSWMTDDFDALVDARLQATVWRTDHRSLVFELVSRLVAAGIGPVLPIGLLAASLSGEHEVSVTTVRDILGGLGALVSRGNPGRVDEQLGISHEALLAPLESVIKQFSAQLLPSAHAEIVSALRQMTSVDPVPIEIARYAKSAAPRHHLAIGDPAGAIKALNEANGIRPADNRDRWMAWIPEFEKTIGQTAPNTLTARNNLAEWIGESGDYEGAAEEFAKLIPLMEKFVGPDHRDTLSTHNNYLEWRGRLIRQGRGQPREDIATLRDQYESLLRRRERVLPPNDFTILSNRNTLASWRAYAGDPGDAVADFIELVPLLRRVLGEEHEITFAARVNCAVFRRESGNPHTALLEFAELVPLCQERFGRQHPYTLNTRRQLAACLAQLGDFAGAVRDLKKLLPEFEHVYGPEHPYTLDVRQTLDAWIAKVDRPSN